VTLNEIGRTAHVAEVLNGTGLGTVSALLCGGFVLVREPGGPGVGLVDRLRFPRGHSIVCAYLGPIETRDALATKGLTRYDALARNTLKAINVHPTLPVFLKESRKFGKKTGFETPRISRLISTVISAGAIGAAQNMIGEAVHAVVEESKTASVLKVVRAEFPTAKAFVSRLEPEGVRLLPENAKH
jgi:pantoate kinase